MTRLNAFIKCSFLTISSLAVFPAYCDSGAEYGIDTLTKPPSASIVDISEAPDGLYVGYYQEDPLTNPEDPVPGTLYLTISGSKRSQFGAMSFAYVGCQSNSIATLTGNSVSGHIMGKWHGDIDGTAQSGDYHGVYEPKNHQLSGTYTNSKGKQFLDLRPCIEYTIAPNGTWELFPVVRNPDMHFTVKVIGKTVTWNAPTTAQFSLLSIIDYENTKTTAQQAIVFQKIIPGNIGRYTVPANILISGRKYIVTITMNTQANKMLFSTSIITANQH
jgi:hypothetical protein